MEKNPLEDSMLTSPTSLSMKNSVLFKYSGKASIIIQHSEEKKTRLVISP
jgi:hypothetical protein